MPRNEPKEPFRRIGVVRARNMIDRGGVQVVDVRAAKELAETGVIAGARHIPVDDVISRSRELSQTLPILFVCAAGVRSALAAEMAASTGRTRLYSLEGGMDAWLERGFPVDGASST